MRQALISAGTDRDAAFSAALGGDAVAVTVMADGCTGTACAAGLDEGDKGDGDECDDAFHGPRFATPRNLRV